MSWEKSSYTTAGAALLSESLSGGALTITRAVSGTDIVETDLSAETTVSGETHELTILAIDTVKDGEETARKVSIQITGAESTYIMHQIGVYGRLNDDAEVLLFIMQDERGIEVPASSVNADFEIEIAALIAISNKAKIEIALSPQMQALMKLVKAEIEKHNAAADSPNLRALSLSPRNLPARRRQPHSARRLPARRTGHPQRQGAGWRRRAGGSFSFFPFCGNLPVFVKEICTTQAERLKNERESSVAGGVDHLETGHLP